MSAQIRSFHFAPPIRENKTIDIECETFTLKNDGNTTAFLDNRWELGAGQSLIFGLQRVGERFRQNINIRFAETTEDGTPVKNLINWGYIPAID
jgi:hypothetical protein